MLKPINSADEFFEKLEREGKVTLLNRPEDYKKQKRLDELCREAKILFQSMNAGSIESAKHCYVGIGDYYIHF